MQEVSSPAPARPGAQPMFIIGAAALWGTAGTVGAFAPDSATPLSIAAARLVIGGLLLAFLAGGTIAATRAAPLPMISTAIAAAAYQACFFWSVSRTGVAVGTVVALGSGPVFTGLITWFADRRRPSGRWLAATSAAVLGCVVLTLGGAVGEVDPAGVLIALLAGLVYAFYAVVAAHMIAKGVPSSTMMGVMFGGAGVVMLPVLALSDLSWLGEPSGLAVAGYLGCATTALACFLYGRGLRSTPVATASTLTLAEPGVAAVLGVAVLGERLGAVSWAGMALLGVSLALLAVRRST
ncbi:EamA family transporter [Rhizohabitans arisaemae]|uniref:EamA family transporter n=1 Tax=Rhizohabitans arisaemae TaxID=2720610 RepID=UPI0024B0D35B|nr:EamA family transporter [Rhizohabitans arisaemae]